MTRSFIVLVTLQLDIALALDAVQVMVRGIKSKLATDISSSQPNTGLSRATYGGAGGGARCNSLNLPSPWLHGPDVIRHLKQVEKKKYYKILTMTMAIEASMKSSIGVNKVHQAKNMIFEEQYNTMRKTFNIIIIIRMTHGPIPRYREFTLKNSVVKLETVNVY